jgi:hypothetical protein
MPPAGCGALDVIHALLIAVDDEASPNWKPQRLRCPTGSTCCAWKSGARCSNARNYGARY